MGGLKHLDVSQELLQSCSSARHQYVVDLEKKKEEAGKEGMRRKRKFVQEEIDSLKAKKRCLMESISHLKEDSDKLYDKAETSNKISYVITANSL